MHGKLTATRALGLENRCLVGADLLAILGHPLVGRRLLVDLVELAVTGTNLVGRLGCDGTEHALADRAQVLDNLAELGIGQEESQEDSKVLARLVCVVLGLAFGDGDDVVLLGARGVTSVRSIDSVLEELVGVLLDHHGAHGLDDVPEK